MSLPIIELIVVLSVLCVANIQVDGSGTLVGNCVEVQRIRGASCRSWSCFFLQLREALLVLLFDVSIGIVGILAWHVLLNPVLGMSFPIVELIVVLSVLCVANIQVDGSRTLVGSCIKVQRFCRAFCRGWSCFLLQLREALLVVLVESVIGIVFILAWHVLLD